jgi:iron complex transport system ATP-binding protein
VSSALRHPLPGDSSRSSSDVRLSVEQVSYAYAPNPSQAPLFTLEAMSFQAKPGELVAILGPNASGKSTLLKLISGALQPLSGRIFLNGFETHSLPVKTRAQRIALVQQESRLLFPSRAWEFVMQGRHPYGGGLRFESEEDILIANNALAQVGATELAERWMDKVSGGEKRYTVVVVTHELNLAGEYADQVVLLQKGKCLRVGPPATVLQREILEQVFQAPLSVELTPSGRPRVTLFSNK